MATLLAEFRATRPDETVIVDEDGGGCTFAELDRRVNQLVHAFRSAGLAVGDTLAVLCGNRQELVEVTLAAMHGGWVVVPVNWHWVADELHHVLVDSGARALLVEAPFADTTADALARGGHVCDLVITVGSVVTVGDGVVGDRVAGHGDSDGDSQLGGVPSIGHEAFVAGGSTDEPDDQCTGGPMFYTSGTTGFPKGVRGGLNRTGEDMVLWQLVSASIAGLLGLPPAGVTLLDGPMYHSAQWAFAMFPLVAGGSSLVMRRRFDPAETLAAIDRHGVTNVHLVPTQFVRLLKLPDDIRAAFDGGSLATVMHGAAPCPPEVKRRMLEWWGPVVSEYYGGTEGGFLTVATGAEWLEHPGTLGRETPMAEVLVLDDNGEPCPPGVSGQIWFRSKVGADFAYHNDPDKTAAAHRQGGLGTLGDVGYLDEDGWLFMSDRRIDMIISGGVNIYPAEIEGVLVTHPAVADAAVFGIPDEEFGEQVMAVVELAEPADAGTPGAADGERALVADLLEHCRTHLAGYKVPRRLEVAPSLPRQPTGKLYKRLLRDPFWQGTGRKI
jgi:long-chain acyl-CoA synthetase